MKYQIFRRNTQNKGNNFQKYSMNGTYLIIKITIFLKIEAYKTLINLKL